MDGFALDKWDEWERASRAETDRKQPPVVRYVYMENLPCRKCGSRWRLPLDLLQIRNPDEPMHAFYTCHRGCSDVYN